MWLGSVVVRASDLWPTGHEFNQQYTTGLVLDGDRLWAGNSFRYVTGHLGQLSLLGEVNRVLVCLAGVMAV